MSHNEKKTVGAISIDLKENAPVNNDVIAQQREMLSDYEKNFFIALERGKKQFQDDFYVVVITKKERLMDNVIRNYFLVRESCATPEFDQIVYKYVKSNESIEILWTIPNKLACDSYRNSPLEVPKEEKVLLNNILSFYDGSLLILCKKLNKELKESSVSASFNPDDFKDEENLIIQK